MAKALIAAVSLAVVLVAAVVVPLVFMPGVFGFNDWPEATPVAPREHVVKLDVPAKRTVVVEHKQRIPAAPKPVAAPRQRLAQVTRPAPQPQPPVQPAPPTPAAPVPPAEPLAAPETQPEPVAIDARQHPLPADGLLDGTNLP